MAFDGYEWDPEISEPVPGLRFFYLDEEWSYRYLSELRDKARAAKAAKRAAREAAALAGDAAPSAKP